jgi:SNF2-related domain
MSFAYQEKGIDWLTSRRTALLAWGMRCGKSRVSLMAAVKRNPDAGILVVGPAVCRSVWRDEAARWRPDLKTVQLDRAGFRWPKPGELCVTTYESTPERFDLPPKGTILILDEGHRVRIQTSGLTQRTTSMAWAVLQQAGTVWALSGTFVCNTPDDLYNVAGILQSQRELADDYGHFVKLWGGNLTTKRRRTTFGTWTYDIAANWHQRKPSDEATFRLSRIANRITREQVANDLPPCTVQVIQVPLSRDVSRMCDEAIRAIHRRGMSLDEAFSLAHINKTASFPEMSRARAAIALCKAPALVELVEDYEAAQEAVVVASAHRASIDGLATRKGWGSITGDTSRGRKEDVQHMLRDGLLRGVGMSIASAGVGIDMSGAAHCVVSDLAWDPGSNNQAVARIGGPRQTKPTTVTYLLVDHVIEHRLRNLLARKAQSAEGVENLARYA